MDSVYERQLDIYDVLVDASGETCPDCPCPADCQAQGECSRHSEELLVSLWPAFDPVS